MLYDVGDIVVVKNYMVEGFADGLYYNGNMDIYKNEVYKIANAGISSHGEGYILARIDDKPDEDLSEWMWLYKWLEPAHKRSGVEDML